MNTNTDNPFGTGLRAFHGDAGLKSAMLAEVERHRLADAFVQGLYYESDDNAVGLRGCAVGCSIDSLIRVRGGYGGNLAGLSRSDHGAYETHLGIPCALARLEDTVFEGLPLERARLWPGEFLGAIPVGADLSMVTPRLLRWILVDEADGVIHFARTDAQREAMRRVGDLYGEVIAGGAVSLPQWREARDAVYAVYAVYVAAAAAYDAAAYDAYDAARKLHCVKIADKLLALLAETSVSASHDPFESRTLIVEPRP